MSNFRILLSKARFTQDTPPTPSKRKTMLKGGRNIVAPDQTTLTREGWGKGWPWCQIRRASLLWVRKCKILNTFCPRLWFSYDHGFITKRMLTLAKQDWLEKTRLTSLSVRASSTSMTHRGSSIASPSTPHLLKRNGGHCFVVRRTLLLRYVRRFFVVVVLLLLFIFLVGR